MTDRNLTFGKRSKVTKPKFKRDDKVAISTNGMRGVYQTIVSSIPKERVGRNISINNSADVVIERVVMNTQNIFKGNVVLEDQTYIALSIEALREDSSLFSFIYSLDWKNYVLDGQKTSFLKELGSRVSDILGVKVDLVNHYTETAKDVMEVINELKESQSPFNINFFTFINLMSKGLFSIEETDTTWINGQSVLVSPYSGRAESFSATCRDKNDTRAFCVVQYLEDIIEKAKIIDETNPITNKNNKVVIPIVEMIDMYVDSSFYKDKGYNSFYAMIIDYLNK